MHTILPGHEITLLKVQLTNLCGCPLSAFNRLVTITATQDGASWIDCVRLQGIKPGVIIVSGCLENISIRSDNLPNGQKLTMRCE